MGWGAWHAFSIVGQVDNSGLFFAAAAHKRDLVDNSAFIREFLFRYLQTIKKVLNFMIYKSHWEPKSFDYIKFFGYLWYFWEGLLNVLLTKWFESPMLFHFMAQNFKFKHGRWWFATEIFNGDIKVLTGIPAVSDTLRTDGGCQIWTKPQLVWRL